MQTIPYAIVVGLDFSPLADRAFQIAYELASKHPASEIHVVCVVHDVEVYPLAGYAAVRPSSVVNLDDTARLLSKHMDELLGKLPGFSQSGVSVVSHVRLDTPMVGITNLASQLEAALIVVGTHGRNGVTRWLLGSVAEGVMRHAACPVLVVPPNATEVKDDVPRIEPACLQCIKARQAPAGQELWCAQHRERHGQRHTYHQGDRMSADTNLPLVAH